jgi:hypothetical protein
MQLSPVQLIESKFIKILVEMNADHDEEEAISNAELDIEHMMHIEKHDTSNMSDPEHPCYVLVLGLRSGTDEPNIRYKFELVVTALVSIDPKKFKDGWNIDDTATKFGFNILYGQIREMLTTLTGRMNGGMLLLPTMNFMEATYPKTADTDTSTTPDKA